MDVFSGNGYIFIFSGNSIPILPGNRKKITYFPENVIFLCFPEILHIIKMGKESLYFPDCIFRIVLFPRELIFICNILIPFGVEFFA